MVRLLDMWHEILSIDDTLVCFDLVLPRLTSLVHPFSRSDDDGEQLVNDEALAVLKLCSANETALKAALTTTSSPIIAIAIAAKLARLGHDESLAVVVPLVTPETIALLTNIADLEECDQFVPVAVGGLDIKGCCDFLLHSASMRRDRGRRVAAIVLDTHSAEGTILHLSVA
jgi:hypothetical protein